MVLDALIVAVAAVALFMGYVAMLPRVATLSRSAHIAAAPDRLFPLIDTLDNWRRWSPWVKRDPAVAITLAGPPRGPNATLKWSGNFYVGSGTLTVLESEPNGFLRLRLEFVRPYPSINFADVYFQEDAGGTRIIWSMTGERPFFSRIMNLAFGIDGRAGRMFESGLANLAAAAR